MIRLLALVLPLGIDTFAVSAAIGVASLSSRERLRVGLIFTTFEAGMPLVGLALGSGVAHVVGRGADYLAIVALVGLGIYMLVHGEEEQDAGVHSRIRGAGAVTLGLSVSLDELAIGFAIGLLRVPVLPALGLIAVQAFVLSYLGLRLGSRLGVVFRERAERAAAGVLLLLAAFLALTLLPGGHLGADAVADWAWREQASGLLQQGVVW